MKAFGDLKTAAPGVVYEHQIVRGINAVAISSRGSKEYFARMDIDSNGTISFDEWLSYAYNHIVRKVSTA